jgi:hypothetical protein
MIIISLFNISLYNFKELETNSKEWKDEILKWDPSENDNITMIRIPVQKPWTPGDNNYSETLI